VSPVSGAEGTVIGASKVARDITERKRAEEALRRAHEELRTRSCTDGRALERTRVSSVETASGDV